MITVRKDAVITELESARSQMRERSKGIGEPAIAIPPAHLLVSSKDPLQIHIRMDHLIELIHATLSE